MLSLVTIKYELIFLNKDAEEENKKLIDAIYERINVLFSQSRDIEPDKHHNNQIEVMLYLCFLKAVIAQQDDCNK